MNKILFVLFVSLLFFKSAYCSDEKTSRIVSFQQTEKEFSERWHDFGGDIKTFILWNPEWKEEELKIRFKQMSTDRLSIYFINPEEFEHLSKNAILQYKETYKTPDWRLLVSRYTYPLSFAYNLASPKYGASIIAIGGQHFLAMEAPSNENLNEFFQLLDDYKATHLVRLTPACEGKKENCFPYWEGRTNIHLANGGTCLEIAGREINYFPTDCWKNHEGIEPERLLSLVKAVMNRGEKQKTIAVHCHAGVGRTGTFIAAYALIQDIDQQINSGVDIDHIKISIDKIFWEISLQRPFCIAYFPQYLTLHKLVNYYISSLKKVEASSIKASEGTLKKTFLKQKI